MSKNQSLTLEFKTSCFRKIPNPYTLLKSSSVNPAAKEPESYIMICDVTSLPADIPMKTNPREQNLKSKVAKKIEQSLLNEGEQNFHLLNRGLLLSAQDVSYDNKNGIAKVTFSDPEVHGNVDGGHTYKIICELNNKGKLDSGKQFVKIEILTHIEDFFQELASARNTSTQVQDKSIAELYNKFDIIKDAIKNQPYAKDIFYRENEEGRIDIITILSILNMFNLSRYPQGLKDFPIVSYTGKSSCAKNYLESYDKFTDHKEDNPYYKMTPIVPDIFKLYDQLEKNIGTYYDGSYGKLSCITGRKGKNECKTLFFQEACDFSSPISFLYPILGAFRALIEIDENGMYKWKQNPFILLDEIGPDLVKSLTEQYIAFASNPNKTAKAKPTWSMLYMLICSSNFHWNK